MERNNENTAREGSFSRLEQGDLFTIKDYTGVVIFRMSDLPKTPKDSRLVTYLEKGNLGMEKASWDGYFHLLDEAEWNAGLKDSYKPYSENKKVADDLLGMARLVNVAVPDHFG